MGSRSKTDLAYIAGFLDGDGSLMLQLKKRKDGRLKQRFMCTICFYQDSRHEEPLLWMKEVLKCGYISRRNDNITELRINGFKQVHEIMSDLLPFIRFKKVQANALLKASKILSCKESRQLSDNPEELKAIVDSLLTIQSANYATKSKKTVDELEKLLELTP